MAAHCLLAVADLPAVAFSYFLAVVPALVYLGICWAYWRTVNHKRLVIQQILEKVELKNLYVKAYASVSQTERDPFASLFDLTYRLPSLILVIGMIAFFVMLGALVSLAALELPTALPET